MVPCLPELSRMAASGVYGVAIVSRGLSTQDEYKQMVSKVPGLHIIELSSENFCITRRSFFM